MKKLIIFFVIISISLLIPLESSAQQPWRHQVSINGTMGIPFGDYADANELANGFGLDATYYLQMPNIRNLFFSASVGFINMPIEYGKGVIQGYDANLRLIPITLGARYNFKLSGLQPYAGLELGYFLEKNTVQTDVSGETESNYENAGIIPKLGIRYPLMSQLDLDANIKLNMIFRENVNNSNASNDLTYLGISVGVAYTIGKSSRFK